VRAAGIILAIALALALQTTLARFLVRGVVGVDLVLVVVVYVALTTGSVTGLLTGAVAGLMQDVVTRVPTSIIGIGGLAKTIVGFLAGIVGTQFIVAQPLPRFVVFFGATVLHALVFMGLYVLLDLRHFGTPVAAVSGQALGNALVGVVAFQVVELLPGAMERRRAQRTRLRR
jgi:rod shape-determining protein MreD